MTASRRVELALHLSIACLRGGGDWAHASLAALVALAERVREWEWARDWQYDKAIGWRNRCVAAEDRVAELERERDQWKWAHGVAAADWQDADERVAELETAIATHKAQYETGRGSMGAADNRLWGALSAGSPTGQEQQA